MQGIVYFLFPEWQSASVNEREDNNSLSLQSFCNLADFHSLGDQILLAKSAVEERTLLLIQAALTTHNKVRHVA